MKYATVAQAVEHVLGKNEAMGSIPISSLRQVREPSERGTLPFLAPASIVLTVARVASNHEVRVRVPLDAPEGVYYDRIRNCYTMDVHGFSTNDMLVNWDNNMPKIIKPLYGCECGCLPSRPFFDEWIIDFRDFIEEQRFMHDTLIIKVCDDPVPSNTVVLFDSDYFKLLMRKVDWEYFNAIV